MDVLSTAARELTRTVDYNVAISVAEFFTIGIGPSSSHTVGPMRAARAFMDEVAKVAKPVVAIRAELFGSLALTGRGHATDIAVLLGLSGETPEEVDPAALHGIVARIRASDEIGTVCGRVPLNEARDLLFRKGEFLEGHSNAIRFTAQLEDAVEITREYHSIGGGATVAVGELPEPLGHNIVEIHPFSSGAELLAVGEETGLSIGEIVARNEGAWRPGAETEALLDRIAQAGTGCLRRFFTPSRLSYS